MTHTHADEPFVPAHVQIPEISAAAVLLGIALSVVMGAANAYLGLYAGMTVSASIPAAVISMAILRGVFRRGTILENNIVQTMASTGESLAAGIVFTVPALVLVGAWQDFRFIPTTLIALLGGLLGIVFMVPMRRALIVERRDLTYPEGLACAEVLVTGERGGSGVLAIGLGMITGTVFKILVSGVRLVKETVESATAAAGRALYIGADMSPALMAVGYIVNLQVAALITLGGVIAWWIVLPLLGGVPAGSSPLEAAGSLWSSHIRFVGVGAMVVGGVSSIWNVRQGLIAGITGLRRPRPITAGDSAILRTEQNIPLLALMAIFGLSTVGTFLFYDAVLAQVHLAAIMTIIMVVVAFLFVAVATYIAGLVGSSNSPVSGMTICALLVASGVLLAMGIRGESAILASLSVAGVVCCATCTAGDIAQDLKTGVLVGATPAKQQWMEMVGAVIPAFFFAPALSLLHHAYGIGTGAPGSLRAPQAVLFASLVQGFFGDKGLPWDMLGIGVGIGVGLLLVNWILGRAGSPFRAHIMPVAVGIYLPMSLDVPILLGGLLRHIVGKTRAPSQAGHDRGVLFGSGIIAGEAIMGILLAIPICLKPGLLPDLGGRGGLSLALFAAVLVGYWVMAKGSRERPAA
ncbi:oligopeptide transporter, OPT family [Candidatus Fermentibacteria bacterium]|nr:oligopeptide transporter, OPT family [Candidatus Fermentibacteria bacterium]